MISAHRVLHAQRAADGALGVVLVRDRGAEDGHDVVADVLVDLAPEALDLLAQAPQRAVDETLDRLGVHALGHGGVARQVGEQHRDLAALLGGRRLVGHRCRRARRRGPGLERRAAVRAEARPGRDGLAARGTALLERPPAAHAEPRALGAFLAAALADDARHGKRRYRANYAGLWKMPWSGATRAALAARAGLACWVQSTAVGL